MKGFVWLLKLLAVALLPILVWLHARLSPPVSGRILSGLRDGEDLARVLAADSWHFGITGFFIILWLVWSALYGYKTWMDLSRSQPRK